VEMEDQARGVVVARCLTLVGNWILWRAWSDKLLFQIKEIGPNETQVKVYAIPNLLRYEAGKDEKVLERGELERLVTRLLV
jgi:hypothetical protein